MKLVIVESPNKCASISHYLGKDYKVMASQGHIRDLSTRGKDGFGVDVDDDFKPSYEVLKDKKDIVQNLKEAKKDAEEVILATDPDREGEAIAWHIAQVLDLDVANTKRLEFHEVTPKSLKAAINAPRKIDMNLVSSQEARRIMDRIIGFKLSHLLKSYSIAKSAGRVQSATLKMICDHEEVIRNFVPEEYWTLKLNLEFNKQNIEVELYKVDGETPVLKTKEDIEKIEKRLKDKLVLSKIETKEVVTEPPAAFKTSTMQRDARAKLKFSTVNTQRIAQILFEGVVIDGVPVGLITYHRTDSTRLSESFVKEARDYIKKRKGDKFLGTLNKESDDKQSMFAQDAHEGIRPTSIERDPDSIRKYLPNNDEFFLYRLIYYRALGSLMSAKRDEVKTYYFDCDGLTFKCSRTVTTFKGFRAFYKEGEMYKESAITAREKDIFNVVDHKSDQHFTEPPKRYTDAKVVALMEEKGIGRPSTYATTISTLQKRGYIISEKGSMVPQETGIKSCKVLGKYFPEIVDEAYTAGMEEELDHIQDGKQTQLKCLNNFYGPFMDTFNKAKETIYKEPPEETGEKCPECGAPLVKKNSRFGEFVGCSNYPKCKYIKPKEKPEVKTLDRMCPECGKPLVERKNKRGDTFIGCSGFPSCHYIESTKPKKEYSESDYVKDCPEPNCGGHLIVRGGKKRRFLGCTNFPKCKHMESYSGSSNDDNNTEE